MGYLRLRYLLQRKHIFMRDVAKLIDTDITRLYDLVGMKRVDPEIDFTMDEKQLIYRAYFPNDPRSLEEVFLKDGDDKSSFIKR